MSDSGFNKAMADAQKTKPRLRFRNGRWSVFSFTGKGFLVDQCLLFAYKQNSSSELEVLLNQETTSA